MTDLAEELPPPQRLALLYAPAAARPATLAVMALDARLGGILRARREPIAAQLRLAWWRDVLAQPACEWPRGEPVLDALRSWRDPSGLAELAIGWEALLAELLTTEAISEFVSGRARAFAGLARELGTGAEDAAGQAARIWARADLASNVSSVEERSLALGYGERLVPPRLPGVLRPLAVLAALGAKALQLGGVRLLSGPGSMLLALRVGLTGR